MIRDSSDRVADIGQWRQDAAYFALGLQGRSPQRKEGFAYFLKSKEKAFLTVDEAREDLPRGCWL